MSHQSHKKVEGKLRIEIFKGRKLTDKALIGTQSPYLVIKIGDKRLVTKVDSKGGLDPKWNQAFEINVNKSMDQTMKIEVWSKETFSDVIIGKRFVYLYDFWKKTPQKGGWWRIHSKQYLHKIRGEIFFRCKLNGKTYEQLHQRKPSIAAPRPATQRYEIQEPPPKMIWQVALAAGVTVRTEPSLKAAKVSYDGKTPVVLEQGTLLDSKVIHKSYTKLKNGKYLITYWIRHHLGWSCCKYGHSQVMIPLSEHKIYEVLEKGGVSCRTTPGLGAQRTSQVLKQGEVIIGRQTMSVNDSKGGTSSWILHSGGWSCASKGNSNFMAQIMYRKAFQVILKDGVSIRRKPSLSAKVVGILKHMHVAVARELQASTEKDGKSSIWLRTLSGWSCLKLDNLVTMIPLGEGQAWWQVTTSAVSIRTAPGIEARKTNDLLRAKDTLVSRGLFPIPSEHGYWVKLRGGYSCFKYNGETHMRLKAGVELWEVTNEAGLYIRSKPGAKKHILGFMAKGDCFLSRGMVSVEDDNFPPTIWVRHGRGWTCIKLGNDFVARPVIPGSVQEIRQKPYKKFNRAQLLAPSAPAVVHVPHQAPTQNQAKLVEAVVGGVVEEVPKFQRATSEADLVKNSEAAPEEFEEIVEAEGVAMVVGEPMVINPAPPAPAVVQQQVQAPQPSVSPQQLKDEPIVEAQIIG